MLQVRAIAFSADDSRLVSCGMDGAVYEWNTLTGARESESVLKTCSYTGVTISPDAKTFFAVGTDCSLKEIQDCQVGTFSEDSFDILKPKPLDSDWYRFTLMQSFKHRVFNRFSIFCVFQNLLMWLEWIVQ